MKTKTLTILIIIIILITGGAVYGQGDIGEKKPGGHPEIITEHRQEFEELPKPISTYKRNTVSDLVSDNYTTITAIVTAYAPFDNKSGMCSDGDPTSTATGTYPKHGTLAADPERLPYGTEIYIPGYGIGTVEDTGGALRNDKENIRIDIYVDTYEEAIEWGRKELVVEIRR
jgi:3D (Asp-Asp-Asp) domain-containing protein